MMNLKAGYMIIWKALFIWILFTSLGEEGYTENATDMAVLTNNPASIEQYFLFLINMYVQFTIYLQYQACQK